MFSSARAPLVAGPGRRFFQFIFLVAIISFLYYFFFRSRPRDWTQSPEALAFLEKLKTPIEFDVEAFRSYLASKRAADAQETQKIFDSSDRGEDFCQTNEGQHSFFWQDDMSVCFRYFDDEVAEVKAVSKAACMAHCRLKPLRKWLAYSVHLSAPSYLPGYDREKLFEKYIAGLYLNLQYLPFYYPGWNVMIYMSDDLDPALIEKVRTFNKWYPRVPGKPQNPIHVETFPAGSEFQTHLGNVWRYVLADRSDVDVIAFRDSDTVPIPREVAAVEAWLKTGTLLQAFHDHHWMYDNWLLAGSITVRRDLFKPFIDQVGSLREYFLAQKFVPRKFDQTWLDANVWPVAYAVDSYVSFGQINFKRDGKEMRCTAFPTPRLTRPERVATGPFNWGEDTYAKNYTVEGRGFDRKCLLLPDDFPYG